MGESIVSAETYVTWTVVFAVFALTTKPLGTYLADVLTFRPTFLDRPWRPVENRLFGWMGVDRDSTMTARQYGTALIVSNLVWMALSYAALRTQSLWPFNPQHFGNLNPALAFNTAASFTTNTNWQAYTGENTLSTFSQFANLGFLQFVTPAAGGAVGMAFLRALSGRRLGNYFVDLTLMCTRVLLPLSVVVAVVLVAQGVPETLQGYLHVHTITGHTQVVPRGPIASWEAIEHLGNNGGGYTNANSASPLENPTPVTNVVQIVSMGVIPVAFFYAFGVLTGRRRTAWTLIGVGGTLFMVLLAMIYVPEHSGNPVIHTLGLATSPNLVGKEVRFGIGGTALFETATMAFTTGSVASAHDSFLPLSQLAFLTGMFLNLVFGGKGVGLVNMVMFVIIAVFLMGLMVGRTPEFLGKKIETREVSLASVAFLLHPLLILAGTALAVATPAGRAGVFNPGPHGLTEILYGFTSAAANNGSAMAGLQASLPFYEIAVGVVVMIGRYGSLVLMLLVGESLLQKRPAPVTVGTMRTEGLLFGGVLLVAIVILNALTFFPVAALGPVAEHYLLVAHRLF